MARGPRLLGDPLRSCPPGPRPSSQYFAAGAPNALGRCCSLTTWRKRCTREGQVRGLPWIRGSLARGAWLLPGQKRRFIKDCFAVAARRCLRDTDAEADQASAQRRLQLLPQVVSRWLSCRAVGRPMAVKKVCASPQRSEPVCSAPRPLLQQRWLQTLPLSQSRKAPPTRAQP